MSTPTPFGEQDLARLQALLDALPQPLEPLDVTMLDGYLCGVLLQPKRPPESAWFPHVLDVDGRAPPAKFDVEPLRALVQRRLAELDDAIERRDWFDPWVYEFDEEASPSETVMPWVAGFATACAIFPALMELNNPELLEPLALLYMHLDPDDLEDADELIAEIETLEPPQELAEAVEGLVRSTLLLADVSRPLKKKPALRPGGGAARKSAQGRGKPPQRPRRG
ncbi:YecA/YgfB family protein [Ideonella sp. BN130291]|uniref:YecA/YgfB family protein n=1 Tax=Ideonella sp. BN130291 TaxID=3112940 RepID=UPI002E2559CD|nr:YecA family protein [Ideonella sp. BN130291]